jgi:hypothetical protein
MANVAVVSVLLAASAFWIALSCLPILLADRPQLDTTPSGRPSPSRALGDYVLTWYSYQDNTPCNTTATASQRPLTPFVSVAVPSRLLKQSGGMLQYGDKLHVKFLEGRRMPNGTTHTGWVRIDDFCGDGGNDAYCYQTLRGRKYPNVDLYVGDITKSGIGCDGGPAGSGQELTHVTTGAPPPGRFVTNYGGAVRGKGKPCDCAAARREQGDCLWHYTPKYEPWWDSVCSK